MKSIRPVLQGPDPITARGIVATLAKKYKEGAGKRELNGNRSYRVIGPISDLTFATLARAIAEDSEHDHYQQRHKDDDDRDLDCRQKETNQQDELFEQGDHHKDQRHNRSESTSRSKNATTHKFYPVEKISRIKISVRMEAEQRLDAATV